MAIPRRLRKPLIPALVALLALGVWAEVWYNRRLERPSPRSESIIAPSSTPAPAMPLPGGTPLSTPRPSPTSTIFAPPDQEALIEVDKIGLMLRDYHTIAGENPVGTNAEIMAAVMGENPKQAKLGPPEGMKLNEKGELVDRWGTPYFFHQMSRDQMEVRSAGADKIMWTDDDAVGR